MEFSQKRGLSKRTFELKGERLKLYHKELGEIKEWQIKIDSIGNDILIERNSRRPSIIGGGILGAFGLFFLAVYFGSGQAELSLWAGIVIGLFYLGLGALIFLTPVKSELHITGGFSTVTFFLDKPSRQKVEEFAHKLIEKSDSIILERYSKIDPDIPEETMMNQLNWLKIRGLLSETEYRLKKEEYKNMKLMN
ncbi:hypothetical protein [Saccharicrinis aurantiacus]|uniref:hypothetical protein n=1 Tax=Saccharicrinis aurantiacus TaxID=1849719 RepID=UPI002493728F|nr:hypothetical protein [Saccharicrinis aurantiacus]